MSAGVAYIDNLLNLLFSEHRPKELRQRDVEREHDLRTLTRIWSACGLQSAEA